MTPGPGKSRAIDEFRRGYALLFAAIAGTAVGLAGTIVYSMPFFLGPLQEAFGFSRKEVAAITAFNTAGLLIGSPVFGRLCDRFGVGRTALASTVGFAAVLLAMSCFLSSLATLYAGYFMVSLLGAGTTYVTYSRSVSLSFEKGRGLALGLTMSGAGLMATIIPQVLPPLIAADGWMAGYRALAVISLIAVPLCLVVIIPREKTVAFRLPEKSGVSFKNAVRGRQFWFIWTGTLILSATVIGNHFFVVQIIQEAGLGRSSATGMVSLYGAAIMVGRVCVGLLLDRFDGARVAAVNFLMPAIGMIGLALFGVPFASAYLIFLGLAAGAEGDLIAYLSGRYFGLYAYSEIFGWLFTALALGVAVGPFIVGSARDAIGSFTPILFAGAACCISVSVIFLMLGRPTDFPSSPDSEDPAPTPASTEIIL